MTLTDRTASLRCIGDDRLKTTDPAEDVRGRTVLDNADKDIAEVDDLLVDDREHKVRFLRVAAGGFLGLGETRFLIPVDAITKMDDKAVHVYQTRGHVVTGRQYDPALMNVPISAFTDTMATTRTGNPDTGIRCSPIFPY